MFNSSSSPSNAIAIAAASSIPYRMFDADMYSSSTINSSPLRIYSSSLPTDYLKNIINGNGNCIGATSINPSPFISSSSSFQRLHILAQTAQNVSSSPSSSSSSDLFHFNAPEPFRRTCSTGDLQGMHGSQASGENHGRETNGGVGGATNGAVGRYTAEERKERIERYRNKRNQRNFSKKITYACRKTLADSRPRVRGRFAKNNEADTEAEADIETVEKETMAPTSDIINFDGFNDDFYEPFQSSITSWSTQMQPVVMNNEQCFCYFTGIEDDLLTDLSDMIFMEPLS